MSELANWNGGATQSFSVEVRDASGTSVVADPPSETRLWSSGGYSFVGFTPPG